MAKLYLDGFVGISTVCSRKYIPSYRVGFVMSSKYIRQLVYREIDVDESLGRSGWEIGQGLQFGR